MRILFLFLIGSLAVILNSCIDGEEEVFINADGSARVKAVYRVPGILLTERDAEELRRNIAEEVTEQDHLKLLTNRVDKLQGRRVITIEIASDDVSQLQGTLSDDALGRQPSKADKILHAIVGTIVVDLDGLSAELNREVDLRPLLDEYIGKNSGSVLGDSEFRYTVHLPHAVESSNAHVRENGGRTLKWTYYLRDCSKQPIHLNMVARVPIPWWVYALGLAALSVAIMVVVVLMNKRRVAVAGIKDTRVAGGGLSQ